MSVAASASPYDAILSQIDLANRAPGAFVFGLVTLRCALEGSADIPSSITVQVGEYTKVLSAPECVTREPSGWWLIRANVMTHLLSNGAHPVQVVLNWGDGTSREFPGYSLNVLNETELSKQVAADLRAHGTPIIFGRVVDSAMFPYDHGQARAWFDEIAPIDVPMTFEPAPSIEAAHRHLERWGFCILPVTLPADLAASFRAELEAAVASKRLPYEQGSSQRIQNAHLLNSGRRIWLYPPVLEFLEAHFRDTPCACQTLTYVHGSEQSPHQDTIHLTPYPAGMMCGVWVALEDVKPDSGELVVYPGSHKAPRLRARDLGLEKMDADYSSYVKFDAEIQRLMNEGGFERFEYRPKAGQILVWHENLVHGGSPRRNRDLTRLSIVSHYFAQGCVAYYDSRGEAAGLEALPKS